MNTQINNERSKSKYQMFKFTEDGNILDVGGVIPNKMKAYGELYPADFTGKDLLDVGCDFGFWSFEAANRGASRTQGLDRGRDERDKSHYDIVSMNKRVSAQWDRYAKCKFDNIDLGTPGSFDQQYGQFDIVMCCSMYHHVYNQCGDHNVIFNWFSQHVKPGGYLLWEGPFNTSDPVVMGNVTSKLHSSYTKEQILGAAAKAFDEVKYIGPAIFSPSRYVYKMSKRS